MVQMEIKSLIASRGLKTSQQNLIRAGISATKAWKLLQGKATSLKLEQIEILCKLLKCSPNDLFVWKPDGNGDAEGMPLNALRRPNEKPPIIADVLKTLTQAQLTEALEQIRKMQITEKMIDNNNP